jgi:hypothetical protein
MYVIKPPHHKESPVIRNPAVARFDAILDGVDSWSALKVADMDSVGQAMTAIEAALEVVHGDWREAFEVLNGSDRISSEAKGVAAETLLPREF